VDLLSNLSKQATGVAKCFASVSYDYFLTISVSPIISTSTGRIFTRFLPFGSAMAVVNDLNLDFRIFKGRCHGNQLSFLRRNSKTTPDRHMVQGKEI